MCLRINNTDDRRWCHCGNRASIYPFSASQTRQKQGAAMLLAHTSMGNKVFTLGMYCDAVSFLAAVSPPYMDNHSSPHSVLRSAGKTTVEKL